MGLDFGCVSSLWSWSLQTSYGIKIRELTGLHEKHQVNCAIAIFIHNCYKIFIYLTHAYDLSV